MRTAVKLAILTMTLAVGGGLWADDTKSSSDRPGSDDKKVTDTRFVDHAYTSGQNEVILNRMALERSRNEDVRKFAQRIIEDHAKANQDLTIIVSELQIAVPDKPLPEQEKEMRRITSNEVKDFDKEFMDQMVTAHEQAVKLFEMGAKELKNDRLKDFASKTLPTLREHLKMAIETRDKVAKGAK
jgi:putative membrane protein